MNKFKIFGKEGTSEQHFGDKANPGFVEIKKPRGHETDVLKGCTWVPNKELKKDYEDKVKRKDLINMELESEIKESFFTTATPVEAIDFINKNIDDQKTIAGLKIAMKIVFKHMVPHLLKKK